MTMVEKETQGCEANHGMEAGGLSFSHSSIPATKEDTPLLNSTKEIKPYKRRWYILLVFFLVCVLQSVVWNTFGPIAQSAKLMFGWTDAYIGMLVNWGNIAFIVVMIPMAWILDVKGLRVSVLLCTALMVLAVVLRCVPCDTSVATWLITVSCILNGFAGTVPFGAPALLSSTWFPPSQRATATAISSISTYVGGAVSFIMGPLVVPEPTDNAANMSDVFSLNTSGVDPDTISNISQSRDIQPQRYGIMKLMYIECGAVCLLFFLVLVYFPARPPSPPSFTASVQRTSYSVGLSELLKHKRFLLILFAYSIPVGVGGVFTTVLDVILHGVGISQNTAGWLGFYGTIAGCASALFISRIADIFIRRMKLFLLFMFVMATGAAAWFVLLRLDVLSYDIVSFFIAFILLGIFLNGSVPLFYELACEASYPIAEGITAGGLALMSNFTGIVFLSVLQIPNIGIMWMNWALLGSVASGLPLILIFKEKYSRMDIDTTVEVNIPPPGDVQRDSNS